MAKITQFTKPKQNHVRIEVYDSEDDFNEFDSKDKTRRWRTQKMLVIGLKGCLNSPAQVTLFAESQDEKCPSCAVEVPVADLFEVGRDGFAVRRDLGAYIRNLQDAGSADAEK